MILHIVRSLRRRGIRFVFMYLRNAIWFDLRYGTNTAFRREKSRQKVRDSAFEDGLLYVASLDFIIKEAVSKALNLLSINDIAPRLIDVGCGKGKTILFCEKNFSVAFRDFLGIEYDANLVAECQTNIRRIQASKSNVLHESGEHFSKHLEGPTLVYFYNSFQGETFLRAFDQAKDTPFVLIYVDPELSAELLNMGYELVVSKDGRYNAERWGIFKSPALVTRS